MKSKVLFWVTFFIVSVSSAQETRSLRELRADLQSFIFDTTFSNAFIGIEVKSLKTGEVIFRHNAEKDFVPASNMKLLTTSTALSVLGPSYTYQTRLMADGYILSDTLFGDLYVVGSGDPTISGRFTNGDAIKTFKDWADTLKLLNIKVIKGNVIGDDRCFDNVPVGGGWGLDWHEDVYWYAAYISGLTFNDNCVDLTIKPGQIGKPVNFTVDPNTHYASFVNTSVTVNDTVSTLDFYRDLATSRIHIYGKFPASLDSMKVSLTIYDPPKYAATVLKESLDSDSITVVGTADDVRDYQRTHRIPPYSLMWEVASYTSPPLSEIVKVINKRSQNLYAEQVFRTLGKEKYGLGSYSNAHQVETKFLSTIGIDTNKIEIFDGSGLSCWDLVSPDAIVKILTAMYKSSAWQYFYDSLPIAGVDGTLEFRMRDTKAQGNVHGKTGFVENVRSLSGYLTTADGEPMAFSIFVNHYTVPTNAVNNLQDIICTRLCNFLRK